MNMPQPITLRAEDNRERDLSKPGMAQTRKFDGACSICGEPSRLVLYNGQPLYCAGVCKGITPHVRDVKPAPRREGK